MRPNARWWWPTCTNRSPARTSRRTVRCRCCMRIGPDCRHRARRWPLPSASRTGRRPAAAAVGSPTAGRSTSTAPPCCCAPTARASQPCWSVGTTAAPCRCGCSCGHCSACTTSTTCRRPATGSPRRCRPPARAGGSGRSPSCRRCGCRSAAWRRSPPSRRTTGASCTRPTATAATTTSATAGVQGSSTCWCRRGGPRRSRSRSRRRSRTPTRRSRWPAPSSPSARPRRSPPIRTNRRGTGCGAAPTRSRTGRAANAWGCWPGSRGSANGAATCSWPCRA